MTPKKKQRLTFPLIDGAPPFAPDQDSSGQMKCPICSQEFRWQDSVSMEGGATLYGPPKPLGDGFVRAELRPPELQGELALSWQVSEPKKGDSNFHSKAPLELSLVQRAKGGRFSLHFCSLTCLRGFFSQCVDSLEGSRKAQTSRESIVLGRKLERVRAAVRKKPTVTSLLRFIAFINELGYQSVALVDALGLDFKDALKEVVKYQAQLSERQRSDAAIINNIGVLNMNSGRNAEARRYFTKAVAIAPGDANIHENLQILDILQQKEAGKRHKVPRGARRGKRTLVGYFDPQAM